MAGQLVYLVDLKGSFKKKRKIQIIESDSEDEVAAINTRISLYKSAQASKMCLSP